MSWPESAGPAKRKGNMAKYTNKGSYNDTERPGMGEFYGGDQIKLTPVTDKQKFARYHKPFSGKGETLNDDSTNEGSVTNDLPAYMLPSKPNNTPIPAQITRQERIDILKAFYKVVNPTIAIDIEYTVDACSNDQDWENLLVKLKKKYGTRPDEDYTSYMLPTPVKKNHISTNLNKNDVKKHVWYNEEKKSTDDVDLLLPVANDYSKLQLEISHLKKIIRKSNNDIKKLQHEVINLKKVNTSIIKKSNKEIESLEENQRILQNNQSNLENDVSILKEELLSLINIIRENNNVDEMAEEIDSLRGVLMDISSQGCELCAGSIAGRCVYHGG